MFTVNHGLRKRDGREGETSKVNSRLIWAKYTHLPLGEEKKKRKQDAKKEERNKKKPTQQHQEGSAAAIDLHVCINLHRNQTIRFIVSHTICPHTSTVRLTAFNPKSLFLTEQQLKLIQLCYIGRSMSHLMSPLKKNVCKTFRACTGRSSTKEGEMRDLRGALSNEKIKTHYRLLINVLSKWPPSISDAVRNNLLSISLISV